MSQGCNVDGFKYYSSTITTTATYLGHNSYAYPVGYSYYLSWSPSQGSTTTAGPGESYGRKNLEYSGGWYYRFIKVGEIEAFTYYTITTQNPPVGGTLSGAGNYDSGTVCTITATPSQGYVVRSIDDAAISPVTAGAKSYYITVNEDKTVSATFSAHYNIAFDANGGSNAPSTITPCLAEGTYQIPYATPTREGNAFLGWAVTQAAAAQGQVTYQPGDLYAVTTVFTPGQTMTLYAVWGQPTITFDANGGDTTPASITWYGTITLPAAITRTGRAFLGWKIGSSVYSAWQNYSLVSDVTAVAQWTDIAIHNTNVGIGTLSLYDITANAKVADEADGWVMYSGTVGHRYRVDCELKTSLYIKLGVYDNGSYIEPYIKTFDGSDIAGEYHYQEKSFYTVGFTASPAAGGSGALVSPASPDKTEGGVDYYVEAQPITIRGTPAAGYSFDRVDWLSNNLPMGSTTPNAQGEATLNNLSFNATAALQFSLIDYSLEAAVDTASASALSVAITVDGETAETANYGETATFTATVANGYSFAGWYDGEGTLVSAANPYAPTVTGDISLVAKAKVAVSLDLGYPSGTADAAKTCSLTVGGETAATLPKEFDVILGQSFTYEVVLGERVSGTNWAFDGWYGDPSDATTVKAYPRSGTITPTEAIEMTAKVASSAVKKLKVYVVNIGETTNAIVDAEDVPDAVAAYGGVTPSALPTTGRPLLGGGDDSDPGWFEFSFDGTQYVEVIASAALTLETEEKVFFGYVKTFAEQFDGQPIPPDSEVISKSNDEVFLLTAGTSTIYAYYGEARVVRTTLGYATGSNATMGEIAIVELDPTDDGQGIGIDTDGMGASSTQGKKLKLLAVPKNGYRFVGWYLNASASGDPTWSGANAEIIVTATRTVYAFFAQDPHAVYEWEGSKTPKSMEWRSKTYAATKPFGVSACRVDAMGYPPGNVAGTNVPKFLELTVDMFSAPDATAQADATATLNNIVSQDARRLPIRRMERYLQVKAEANVEVDALLVGTSMEGLRA